jgi:MFS family permease
VFLLAQFFQVVQGQNPLQAGLRTMPWTMAPMVFAPLAGLLVGRVGARTLLFIGNASLAIALGWIALLTGTNVDYSEFIAPFLLAGAGMGLSLTPMSATLLGSVRPESTGVASGTNNTLREIGVAMGVAVLSSVFAARGSYVSPQSYVDGLIPAVWVGAAVVAIGAVLALLLPGRRSVEVPQ